MNILKRIPDELMHNWFAQEKIRPRLPLQELLVFLAKSFDKMEKSAEKGREASGGRANLFDVAPMYLDTHVVVCRNFVPPCVA